jgi:sterol desaturase/sphingolipid hydroxylase (fatty acid hydroxylase superfamily)
VRQRLLRRWGLIWLFPGKVRGYHVLGVDVVGFAFAVLGANLRHSHVWLSYGPFVERLAISPAHHQVHHSVDAKHHDRNFGSALAIWDWMFGTRRGIEILVGARRQREGHRPGPDATPTAARGRSLLPH